MVFSFKKISVAVKEWKLRFVAFNLMKSDLTPVVKYIDVNVLLVKEVWFEFNLMKSCVSSVLKFIDVKVLFIKKAWLASREIKFIDFDSYS